MEMNNNDSLDSLHLSFDCNGMPWKEMGSDTSNTWLVHFLAGITLLVWGAHWNIGVFKSWLTQTKQTPFVTRNTYPVPFLPQTWQVESFFKCILPPLSIFAQLWWSDGAWKMNICPEGTVRAGHFYASHISAWANTWVLVMYMLSGLVDILGYFIELPTNTEHLMTASAFAIQAFILNTGLHPDMLAGLVYYLLFMTATAIAVFLVAEMGMKHAFFISCGKVYATYLLGIWYLAAARFLYEGRPAWQTMEPFPDMAPAAFVVVPYAFWMNMTSLSMLAVYLLMKWFYGYNEALETSCTKNRSEAEQHADESEFIPLTANGYDQEHQSLRHKGGAEMVPLVER